LCERDVLTGDIKEKGKEKSSMPLAQFTLDNKYEYPTPHLSLNTHTHTHTSRGVSHHEFLPFLNELVTTLTKENKVLRYSE
jgi:hypothetical protein